MKISMLLGDVVGLSSPSNFTVSDEMAQPPTIDTSKSPIHAVRNFLITLPYESVFLGIVYERNIPDLLSKWFRPLAANIA